MDGSWQKQRWAACLGCLSTELYSVHMCVCFKPSSTRAFCAFYPAGPKLFLHSATWGGGLRVAEKSVRQKVGERSFVCGSSFEAFGVETSGGGLGKGCSALSSGNSQIIVS